MAMQPQAENNPRPEQGGQTIFELEPFSPPGPQLENQDKYGRGAGRYGRLVLTISAALVIASIGLAAWHFRYNFHEVRPGQLYRCGQIPDTSWENVLREYGIRTVINLRGKHPERTWYRAEVAAAKNQGALHLDLGIDRHNLPEKQVVERLIHWHETVPRPVLVHCQSGADRTTMVVVLWLLLESDSSLDEARAQTGWWFGQLPWRNGARQMHHLLDNYQNWLEQRQCQHSPGNFRLWFEQEYARIRERGNHQPEPLPIVPLVQD